MDDTLKIKPGTGQTWENSETGEKILLLGRQSKGWVARKENTEPTWVRNLDGYTWRSCDHDNYCCSTHDLHTSPHKGCVLR